MNIQTQIDPTNELVEQASAPGDSDGSSVAVGAAPGTVSVAVGWSGLFNPPGCETEVATAVGDGAMATGVATVAGVAAGARATVVGVAPCRSDTIRR